jgi:hypothetical protein
MITEPIVPPQNNNRLPSRKSTRASNRHVWLKDFVTSMSTTSTTNFCSTQPQYPLFGKIDFKDMPPPFIAFLANVFAQIEPTSYSQASKDKGWVEGMDKEIKALEVNDTWEATT